MSSCHWGRSYCLDAVVGCVGDILCDIIILREERLLPIIGGDSL